MLVKLEPLVLGVVRENDEVSLDDRLEDVRLERLALELRLFGESARLDTPLVAVDGDVVIPLVGRVELVVD